MVDTNTNDAAAEITGMSKHFLLVCILFWGPGETVHAPPGYNRHCEWTYPSYHLSATPIAHILDSHVQLDDVE